MNSIVSTALDYPKLIQILLPPWKLVVKRALESLYAKLHGAAGMTARDKPLNSAERWGYFTLASSGHSIVKLQTLIQQ